MRNLTTVGAVVVGLVAMAVFSWQGLGQEQGGKSPNALGNGVGSADSALKLLAFGDPAANGLASSQGVTLLKGGSYQVRSADENIFTADTKRVPYEVYRDEDFHTQVIVSESGSVAAIPYRKTFQIRILGLGQGGYEAIRFSATTGAAWRLKNERWQAISEPAGSNMPFPSEYDIQLSDVGGGGVAMRLDLRSGASWILAEDSWQAVPE